MIRRRNLSLNAAVRVLLGLIFALAAARSSASAGESVPRFNRDIRPILSDNCFLCHGFDSSSRKAKLRLDVREVALARKAFVPGKADESELVRRIFSGDPDEVMPPPDTHKTLTPAQKDLLKRWVAAGAEYEPHWAYTPVQRPEPPALKERKRAANPVDAFVLAPLEARGIRPSPPADPRVLLRRLSLDLTGLPPSADEMNAFLKDRSARAWEKQVDRLLASPHFGERMAVPWLDVVRYADTVGYHGDQNQNVFPYRDYVIESFNRNKPFDQFTVEQIAGDLLPQPTEEQIVATGFNRLNMVTREGGAQPKEYLAKYAADRVRTVSTTWLGSTMACNECHDHKYDPFTIRDFYALAAFFSDVKEWGVYNDYKYTPNPDLKGWSNEHPFPPERTVESAYLKRRAGQLRRRIDEVLTAGATARKKDSAEARALNDWQQAAKAFLTAHPEGWAAPEASVSGTNSVALADGRIVFRGKLAKDEQQRVTLKPASGWLAALRLELLPHEDHKGSVFREGRASSTLTLSATLKRRATTNETKLAFYHADAASKDPRYSNGREVVGIRGGWRTSSQPAKSPQNAVWLLDPPVQLAKGDSLRVTLQGDALGCVRLGVSPLASLEPAQPEDFAALREALRRSASRRSGSQRARVEGAFQLGTAVAPARFAEFKQLYAKWLDCREGRATTLITVAWEPRVTRVLPRGNWMDDSGEIVRPAPPHFLPQPKNAGGRLTRLDLARWLVARENPLTARVFVNRLWKQFFGAGLSGQLYDLGAQGEPPTHPELLDWLAAGFIESGWDVKQLVKRMVMSHTYRQDSTGRPELKEIDPNNRLLARQNPRRLEAEFVRDHALFVAGLLNREIGGPSAFPYQPAGYYENLQFPKRDYVADVDDQQYRRGLYAHWQRTFLHPMLANFDAPSREECTADRVISNTPQQALTLLNDPTYVEAARVFAGRLLLDPRIKSDEARIAAAFEQAVGRAIQERERKSLRQFLTAQRAHYAAHADETQKLLKTGLRPAATGLDATEHAAWTSVCRVILNLHETITRY